MAAITSFPIIDYAAHPAFAGLDIDTTHDDAILNEMNGIDQAFANTTSAGDFQRESQEKWNHLASIVQETVVHEVLREHTLAALKKARTTMAACSRWSHKPRKRPRRDVGDSAGYLQQLHEDGAACITFPESVKKQLCEMLSDERAETVKRHDLQPIDRCVLHMKVKGPAFELAWKTLKQMGVFTALSNLFGRDVEPMYWYLAYNTSSESWYKDCYQDVGIPTSRFAYAHYDNDFELAKLQIYLTDVEKDNGPFSFVPGSHKWTGCKTQQYVFKEMDRTIKYPKNDGLYYRPRFGTPEYRKLMAQLPSVLLGSSHFGDDVLEGTQLWDDLDENFRSVTSDLGNCAVFAGGDLLHYGGLVSGADRWVLQLGVATERPHSAGPPPKQSLLRKVASKTRKYVGDRPIDAVRTAFGFKDAEPKQNQYKPTT